MATIRKRNGKFQVQVRRLGSADRSKTFLNRKDAEAWARMMEVQADRRDLPANPKELERWTLGDLVKRYRDTVSPAKRGGDNEKIKLNAFLRHQVCSKPLSALSLSDFAQYTAQRLKDGINPATIKRQLSPIHNLFTVAQAEWGLPLKANPLDGLRLETPDNGRERRLRQGELERIVAAAQTSKNPIMLPVILFALETGLRRSEILGATWAHLDLENRVLVIPKSKNGHSRSIPLTKAAGAILRSLTIPCSVVHKGDNANERIFPITPNALRLSWERIKQRAGIEDLHFHDLRHEAISRFFEHGLTMPEIALLSGHRTMKMLFRYSHPQRQRILEQFDKADL